MSFYVSIPQHRGADAVTRRGPSRRTAAKAADSKGQFRPEPLKPPPAPMWVSPKENFNTSTRVPPKSAPPVDPLVAKALRERQDPNYINYQVYLRNYDVYLTQLEKLKERFWDGVEKKSEAGKTSLVPAGEEPPDDVKIDDGVPMDAATLQREKETKARRAAARRRQRAARRLRDREAKVQSLKTQVELAKVSNQLQRVTSVKLPTQPRKPSTVIPGVSYADRASIHLAAPVRVAAPGGDGPGLVRPNAQSRRRARRQGMVLAPGRAPEDQSPTADAPS